MALFLDRPCLSYTTASTTAAFLLFLLLGLTLGGLSSWDGCACKGDTCCTTSDLYCHDQCACYDRDEVVNTYDEHEFFCQSRDSKYAAFVVFMVFASFLGLGASILSCALCCGCCGTPRTVVVTAPVPVHTQYGFPTSPGWAQQPPASQWQQEDQTPNWIQAKV